MNDTYSLNPLPLEPSRVVQIFIPGNPIGKPRMTQRDKWKKRPAVVRYRAWKDKTKIIFRAADLWPPLVANEIMYVSWVAFFECPKSWPKKKKAAAMGQAHRSKPDRDNIDKALLDTLFDEDSGIYAGILCKKWADENSKPGLVVEIGYD